MIAVIGMVGRFAGSDSIEELWKAVLEGKDLIRRFSREELVAAGVPAEQIDDPSYVPARGWFDGQELFDAEFFGLSSAEAELTDPQHRLFLTLAWQALESAGLAPNAVAGRVGVFAGCAIDTYLHLNLGDAALSEGDPMPLIIGNEKDFLPTRVSYKLGLEGPSVNVQTACSTSLTAVHLACESLRSGECDLVLAGGVSLFAKRSGYHAHPGGITSPDGVCRPFDRHASGFVPGNGAAIVVLKRLEDAERDGDTIRAVIEGTAMVNDGAGKLGFTAPSVHGQVRAMTEALAVANVSARDIGYIETHGTATELGDTVEFEALRQVFDGASAALGAIKANIGHTDTAAGVAGFVKACLVVESGIVPPLANFDGPNPRLRLDGTTLLLPRARGTFAPANRPRRAAVNSLGLGGTNVHAIVREPPPARPRAEAPGPHLVVLSATTAVEVTAAAKRLARRIETAPVALEDVSFTMALGRAPQAFRASVVARTPAELVIELDRVAEPPVRTPARAVGFLFPGGGAQYGGMERALAAHEPTFRAAYGACDEILRVEHGIDLALADDALMRRPAIGLPALFAFEYALARLWLGVGVRPAAVAGHSLGEYVAATVAGIFSLRDALRLVVTRGRLFETLPPGRMLSVALAPAELERFCDDGAVVAAINGPSLAVLSGDEDALVAVAARLEQEQVPCRLLHIDVAAHSPRVDSILPAFRKELAAVRRNPPTIPLVSTLTGVRLTDAEATSVDYWARQLRETVRFGDAVATLAAEGIDALLEVGPGETLTHITGGAIASLSAAREDDPPAAFREAAGRLWQAGIALDWPALLRGGRRVPLPPTAFVGQWHWAERKRSAQARVPDGAWVATWIRRRPRPVAELPRHALVLDREGSEQAARVAARLEARGVLVTRVPLETGDVEAALAASPYGPADAVVHLAGIERTAPDSLERAIAHGPAATLRFVQALARTPGPLRLVVVSRTTADIIGTEDLDPFPATTICLGHALTRELPGLRFAALDLDEVGALPDLLVRELAAMTERSTTIGYRSGVRWVRDVMPVALPPPDPARIREGSTWVITGGLGGMGLEFARHLAAKRCRIALVTRGGLRGDNRRTAVRRAAVEACRRLGGEVIVLEVDVASRPAVLAAMAEVCARFGKIDGIIHAAGQVAGGLAAIKTPEELRRVLAPKVDGAYALLEAVAHDPPDAFVLCSALDAQLGTLGLADHAAANGFLDAFAPAAARRLGREVVAIGWQAWREVGQAASIDVPPALRALRDETLRAGYTNAEGIAMLDRCLAAGLPHVVAVTRDLRALIDESATLALRLVQGDVAPAAAVRADRPYRPPESETEALVCTVLEQVLGVARVGRDEDFFALGGHSLLGISVMNRLRHAFGVALPLATLIKRPTPQRLAEAIDVVLLEEIEREARP